MKKPEVWEASRIYIYGQIFSDLTYYACACSQVAVKCMGNGKYMLIFQPHLPHIFTNSWQLLHDLSHSKIM